VILTLESSVILPLQKNWGVMSESNLLTCKRALWRYRKNRFNEKAILARGFDTNDW